MADNVPITPGTGTTIATDDVAGVQFQMIKVVDATADGTNRLVVTPDGAAVTDPRRGITYLFAAVNATASGDNTIVAASATNRIKVINMVLVADGAVAITWKSGAATALSGAMSLAANGGIAVAGQGPNSWLLQTAVNQALVLNLGAAVGVRGHIAYFLEP